MPYTDTTLVPAGGFTFVNYKQVYDNIVASLPSGNWSLDDTVDFVSGLNTFRHFVWRCASAGSGLTADYFVVFRVPFTTTGTVWHTNSAASDSTLGFRLYLGELYNSTTKVLSKFAPMTSGTAVTMAADRTNPGTWTLNAALPATAGQQPNGARVEPTVGNLTSLRLFVQCNVDTFALSTGSPFANVYVGAMESLMNTTDDPMPIIIGGVGANNPSSNNSGGTQYASTRHPRMTPSASITNAWAFAANIAHVSAISGSDFGSNAAYARAVTNTNSGVLGDPANTATSLFTGTVPASKIGISTIGSTTASTRGGLRGFLKNMVLATTVAHTVGDTFLIDGVTHVGCGTTDRGLLRAT